jgi:uncharacterized protein
MSRSPGSSPGLAALLPRGIVGRITDTAASVPVIVLEGPRACGKTSVAMILRDQGVVSTIADLADPTVFTAAQSSPTTFIDALPLPALIDETQLVPELALAVKRRVDRERKPGLFVLTGSSRLGRSGLGGSDPLAGRSIRLRMAPMTQAELQGDPVQLVDALIDTDPPSLRTNAATEKSDLMARIRRGGFPAFAGVVAPVSDLLRQQLFAEYVEGVIHHEVGRRADRAETIRLLRYLAASTSRLLNTSTVASEMRTTRETIQARIALLDAAFLVHQLPGHRPAEHRTLTAHPKLHAADVGLAAWASRLDDHPPAALFAALVETFVINELVAQAQWSPRAPIVRHWRDTARKTEVDAVLLDPAGGSVAIEVKASSDVRPDDLKGLRRYVDTVHDAKRGIIFYTGALTLPMGDRVWAVPIAALWQST